MPKSLRDPFLGLLNWDDKLQWWIGETEWLQGQSVEFFISPGEGLAEVTIHAARSSLDQIRDRDLEYRHWTAEQVKDDRWNSEEDMTVEEITNLLKLASIDFHSWGGAALYWNDEDRLYGGHNLITEIDPSGECVEVRMEG
jgi:hypothetical protein